MCSADTFPSITEGNHPPEAFCLVHEIAFPLSSASTESVYLHTSSLPLTIRGRSDLSSYGLWIDR